MFSLEKVEGGWKQRAVFTVSKTWTLCPPSLFSLWFKTKPFHSASVYRQREKEGRAGPMELALSILLSLALTHNCQKIGRASCRERV